MVIEKWHLTSLQYFLSIILLIKYLYVGIKYERESMKSNTLPDYQKLATKLWLVIIPFFALNLIFSFLIKYFFP